MWTSTGSENCSSSKPYTNICKIFQNSKCREPFLPPFWDGHKGIIPNKNINFSADNNSIKWYWSIKPQTRLYCRICGIYLGIGNNNTEVRMHCHQNFKGKINKPIYLCSWRYFLFDCRHSREIFDEAFPKWTKNSLRCKHFKL